MVPGTFFAPCEAMKFLPTGVRLAAGANFYIPEIPWETERRERVTPAFCLLSRGSGAGDGEGIIELILQERMEGRGWRIEKKSVKATI
jgi:hypothetical protein